MDPTSLLLTILLAAPTCDARDAAERLLAAQGVVAYPALVAASSSSDPEVRCRCGRLIDALPALSWAGWLAKNGPPPLMEFLPRDYRDAAIETGTPGEDTYMTIYWHYMNQAEWNQTIPQGAIASQLLFRELFEARRFHKAESLLTAMRTLESARRNKP